MEELRKTLVKIVGVIQLRFELAPSYYKLKAL
jgi:hypothetical protein